MKNDIIERAARIERKRAQRRAAVHLPAIVLEIRKARLGYREASQKARSLWVKLCRRSGLSEEKWSTIDALAILQDDPLNKECREAVLDLNKKASKLGKLLAQYQRIKGRKQNGT